MSLYDKASLIFSGAAGAGNKDVAYNIKPVEKLKVDELITNGGFDTDSDWTKGTGITISGGKAVFTDVTPYQRMKTVENVFVSGKTYKLSYEVTEISGGKIAVQQDDQLNINNILTDPGKYSHVFEAKTYVDGNGDEHVNTKLVFKVTAGTVNCKIDNVSLKEVEQKANDFSFVRASDLTATYEGADGLIKKTRENLLLQSNQFDTTWTLTSVTVSSGQTGYDGSTNAWLVTKSSTGGRRLNQTSTVSGVFTYSCYAKAGTLNGVILRVDSDSGNAEAQFNLTGNGSVHFQTSTCIDSSITKIGSGGWFRCSLTSERTLTDLRIYPATETGALTSTGTIYIQNAQLEQGLVATPYIDRTDSYSKSTSGIQEDEPRYDYSLDNALPPVLMLEPERTNELPHSEYLNSFVKNTGITLTSNTTETKSPEGLYNATKVVSTNSNGGFYKSGLNITDDTVNSIYLKGAVGGETCKLKDPGGYGGITNITLTTDWVRYELKSTYSGIAGQQHQGLYVDDIASGSTIYAWGAQKEKGSYATSYIPTYGSAATRKGEAHNSLASFSCKLDKPLTKKYTFILDLRVDNLERPTTSYDDIFTARDDSGTRYAFRLEGNVDTSDDPDTYSLRVFAYSTKDSGAALSTPHDSGIQLGQRNKIAIVFDETVGIKVFLNGNSTPLEEVLIGDTFSTDSTKTLQSSSFYEVKTLDGGANPRSKTFLYGVQAYDEALSDAECVSLTTIS